MPIKSKTLNFQRAHCPFDFARVRQREWPTNRFDVSKVPPTCDQIGLSVSQKSERPGKSFPSLNRSACTLIFSLPLQLACYPKRRPHSLSDKCFRNALVAGNRPHLYLFFSPVMNGKASKDLYHRTTNPKLLGNKSQYGELINKTFCTVFPYPIDDGEMRALRSQQFSTIFRQTLTFCYMVPKITHQTTPAKIRLCVSLSSVVLLQPFYFPPGRVSVPLLCRAIIPTGPTIRSGKLPSKE